MAKTPSRVAASASKPTQASPKNPRKSQTLTELLSRAEQELVDSSIGKQLAALTEKELKRITTRARSLYDKWSDQLRGQSRSAKATNRSAASTANARTADKVTVFGEALARFEARLEEIASSVVETVTGQPAANKAVKKASQKKVTLKTAKKKVAKKKASPPSTTPSPRAKKAKARQAIAADSGQLLHTDPAKQRKAKAAAAKAAYKNEGLTTRRTQSAASATRRNQARRDSK
jgi:hypothetical protein